MTAKKVFVTGGAGQTGIHAVKWIAKEGKNLDIWAGIHKGEETEQENVLKTHNVHPAVIEAGDTSMLTNQFKEVQDLFIIPPATENKVKHACNYIDAAHQAGVKFVLLLSVVGADRDDYTWGRQFSEIEDYLKKTVDRWCILRTPFYMQNLLLYKSQLADGELPLPIGKGKFAPMDVADIGMVAGSIISDCASHICRQYELTGDRAMSGEDMAKVFTKVIGRTVEFKDTKPEEAREILANQNVPNVEIKGLLDFYEIAKKKEFAETTTTFKDLTGKNPKTLEEFLAERRSVLQ